MGFDKEVETGGVASKEGTNAHYRSMYHAIQTSPEAAQGAYRHFCATFASAEIVLSSLARRLLVCNPFFPEFNATVCATVVA